MMRNNQHSVVTTLRATIPLNSIVPWTCSNPNDSRPHTNPDYIKVVKTFAQFEVDDIIFSAGNNNTLAGMWRALMSASKDKPVQVYFYRVTDRGVYEAYKDSLRALDLENERWRDPLVIEKTMTESLDASVMCPYDEHRLEILADVGIFKRGDRIYVYDSTLTSPEYLQVAQAWPLLLGASTDNPVKVQIRRCRT